MFVKKINTIGHINSIKNILKKQGGTLLSADLDKNKIPRVYLSVLLSENKIERIGRGVYVATDSIEDEMFILQKKYPSLIYSHETALFLHNLSDRTPFEYSVTVPSGYKAADALLEKSKIYYIKKDLHLVGIIKTKTLMGNIINVYNMERTICDILRSRSRIDIQIFSTALQRALKVKHLNYSLLSEYAELFKVKKLLNLYTEVMI
jgi:predicted transcriptional regulator of viral defense system